MLKYDTGGVFRLCITNVNYSRSEAIFGHALGCFEANGYFCSMKVTTLDNESFVRACGRLEELTRGFGPDLIVGIATGGEIVAGNMYPRVRHVAVKACRPTTALKSRCGWFWKLVRHLPMKVCDLMRVVEAALFNNRKGPLSPIEIADERRSIIAVAGRILVIDDAIDSGVTMVRVVEALRQIAPQAKIAKAVVNVTTKKHLIEPDYRLFPDRRLVRFPWSKDFRG